MVEKPEHADASQPHVLRPIGRDDDAAIGALLGGCQGAPELPDARRPPGDHGPAPISVEYSQARAAYFVVEQHGRLIGGSGFGPLAGARGEVCQLRGLCVAPDARGQGLATELVEHCLVVALAFGYRHCYAELFHSMRPAIRLLERLQFSLLNQPVGQTGRYLYDRWYLRDL